MLDHARLSSTACHRPGEERPRGWRSRWTAFVRIVLPLSAPGPGLGIHFLVRLLSWNEYFVRADADHFNANHHAGLHRGARTRSAAVEWWYISALAITAVLPVIIVWPAAGAFHHARAGRRRDQGGERLFPPTQTLPHKEGGARVHDLLPSPLVGEGPGMGGQRRSRLVHGPIGGRCSAALAFAIISLRFSATHGEGCQHHEHLSGFGAD